MKRNDTLEISAKGAGSTLVRARELLRRAKLDFGQAHELKARLQLGVTVSLAVMLALSVLLVGGDQGLIEYAELPLQSMRVRAFEPNSARHPDILLVNIDDAALAYGDMPNLSDAQAEASNRYAWPWPRHVYNKIIRYCREGGARVVVFDLLFSESGPNTNMARRFVVTGGRKTLVNTFDSAGDDMFTLEATARDDVAVGFMIEKSARARDLRDELVMSYAVDLQGPEGARNGARARFAGYGLSAVPMLSLLDGVPGNLRNILARANDEERLNTVNKFRQAINNDAGLNETQRMMSLLPLTPADRVRGVAGLGMANVFSDVDGTNRRVDVLGYMDGRPYPAFALEIYRLWVLSLAREAQADASKRSDFAARLPGLAVDERGLTVEDRIYDLSRGLKDVPLLLEDGLARYLGREIPLDAGGRAHLRYRGWLAPKDLPSYQLDPATYTARGGSERPFAVYPCVSAREILQDYDFLDQNRRIESAEQEIARLQADLDKAPEDRKAAASKALEDARAARARLAAKPLKPDYGNPASLVKDKIVIVAGTAAALYDRHQTPLDFNTPGTWVVATALDNLMRDDFMRTQPRWQVWAVTWLCAAAAVFSVLLLPKLRHSVPLVAGLALLVAGAGVGLFFMQQWFAVAGPLAGLFCGLTGGAAAKALTEGRQRAQREAFARQYMGNELVAHVIKQPGALKLGGQNREMTIYFSDVAGFTTLTETLGPENPERLVELLNIYLERMTDLMLASGAVIDKYIGDAIMCFWGAPRDMADHAVRACQAALMCKREMARMQPLFADAVRHVAPQLIGPDGTVLSARAGINSGLVTVGNMGSSKRFAYTVMGDAVNLASRLEGQNKEYGSWIMLGENTEKLVRGQFTVRRLDLIVVKGKTRPTEVFELLGENPVPDFIAQLVEYFETGIEAFRQRDFERALHAFEHSLPLEPDKDDSNPSRLYIERCKALIETPPPPDWNGVYVKKSK